MAASKRAANASAAATFHDHLKELRARLFVVAVVFVAAASVAFSYKDWLLDVLMRPLEGEKLIYLTPAGGFSFIFQVSMYAGLVVAVPVLIYNIFRFIAPVLPSRTRLISVVVMLSSVMLLLAGVSFGYFYAIPAAMQFLIHFADGFVSASLTAESYLGFVMAYTAGLGLLFQLPLIIMFIHWIKPLSPLGLLKFERYMILLSFVAAAIISPTPDALNQVILAAPIIAMYQLGVIGVWISVRRTRRHAPTKIKKQALTSEHKISTPRAVTVPIPQLSKPTKPTPRSIDGVIASTQKPAKGVVIEKSPVSHRGYAMDGVIVRSPRKVVQVPPARQVVRPAIAGRQTGVAGNPKRGA